ncbi:ComEA family DNA-binding protein [Athalassotoga saccharophila]|uniref:ComEA family DNA-binding protein n=1 Tax=Athalassotoga saccharophila TaxID=1441386 RepID=UPI001E51613E|nr:ComEA family DNA-binding protein [Athalassotoga saccharophila]BBJ27901.1 late competence protein ComEA, DNA receptor [Athalassotoga saccharophila]
MSTRTRIVIGSIILIFAIGIFISAITPLREGIKKSDKAMTSHATSVFPVNINTADEKTLEMLPGIGPSKARSIVDYRKKIGSFQNLEDLLKVPGIGPSTLDKFSGLITGISTATSKGNQKININSATAKEIENLPSIGQIKAREIVSYREVHGPFRNLEDLKKVSGIGTKTIQKIKDLIEF